MTPGKINVLIACEESQAETMAFRKYGFNAYSCDIQPCRKGTPEEWHIQDDVTLFLHGATKFRTQDGKLHQLKKWHLIIAHPPCTYICRVSSVHMVINGEICPGRLQKMKEAVAFFYECMSAQAEFVAVENPIPMKRAGLPRPSCYACPSWYGVKYTKKTYYWTRNLPPLFAEIIHSKPKELVHNSRGKYRSRTFPQMADAIARQWGFYILDELNKRK